VEINLSFKPRSYQLPILDALENKGYRRVMAILPRRAGKDVCAFNVMIRAAIRRIGTYYYIFPTYGQARKVIWDAIMNDGKKFIDFIPTELIVGVPNSQEMKIKLRNGSLIQLIGSDNVDSLVGTNPQGIVFSEYAIQDPNAYSFLRPVLVANDGWALFISTPRGKNHLYDMWQIASKNPDWFAYKLTLDDTKHISKELIDKEKEEGLMSDDLIQQEYYCSFDRGVEGSYYAKYMDGLRLKGQIGTVTWEPSHAVHTAWDIGVRDSTSIIFFQCIGTTVRIIDYYEKQKEGLEHYINLLNSKPYTYGKHIAPHDIAVKEWGSGMTRLEKAKQLGIKFIVAPNISIMDGIESARTTLPRCWIDERNCQQLIKALDSYRQEWDSKRRVYNTQPLHDFSSHASDAFRYLSVSLPRTRDGLSAQDLDKRFQEAKYGVPSTMPRFLSEDVPYERF
jgi:phage terminase large subunit